MLEMIVYGTGCAKCKKLYELTDKVTKELGVEYSLNKVEDMMQIVEAGVMVTPALKINGKAFVSGRVPSEAELAKIISDIK